MNGQAARWTEEDRQTIDRKSKRQRAMYEVKRGRGGVVVVEQ